jgi:hypothetical protein
VFSAPLGRGVKIPLIVDYVGRQLGPLAFKRQPGADLTPQFVVVAVTLIYHDAGPASTGLFA